MNTPREKPPVRPYDKWYAVFVLGSALDRPIAVFGYDDQATAWAGEHYFGRYTIMPWRGVSLRAE